MSLALSNKTIDKYLRFLKKLDNTSKKKLIIRLTESIETREKEDFNLNSLFGAWKDERGADEIIKEIRESRTFNQDREEF